MQTYGNTAIFDPDLHNVIDVDVELYMLRKQRKRRKEQARNRKIRERKLYFLEQKLTALFVLILTVVLGIVLNGCGGVIFLTVVFPVIPAEIYLMFTDKAWLVNDYWKEYFN